jgi:hypothetical protein
VAPGCSFCGADPGGDAFGGTRAVVLRTPPRPDANRGLEGCGGVALGRRRESGKIGDFGIGPPKENRTYFADNSMQALFLWDEIGQSKLDMLMARLAYEGAHGAPECTAKTPPANPTPTQWCGIKTNYASPQSFNGAVVGPLAWCRAQASTQ